MARRHIKRGERIFLIGSIRYMKRGWVEVIENISVQHFQFSSSKTVLILSLICYWIVIGIHAVIVHNIFKRIRLSASLALSLFGHECVLECCRGSITSIRQLSVQGPYYFFSQFFIVLLYFQLLEITIKGDLTLFASYYHLLSWNSKEINYHVKIILL